jgi:hypothetical protein
MEREWVRIRRKVYGMPDIILRDVTIIPSNQIENIVTVSGKQQIEVDTKMESQLPTQTVLEDLPWWDPRRLFGITTREVEVPDTSGWELQDLVHTGPSRLEFRYVRNEMQPRTYRINSTWLEMSTEE